MLQVSLKEEVALFLNWSQRFEMPFGKSKSHFNNKNIETIKILKAVGSIGDLERVWTFAQGTRVLNREKENIDTGNL
jgi:hypothetical protein